jgi:hypothetical protein
MDLFLKKDPNREEYIFTHALTMLGLKKIGQEKVDKIIKNDDNKYVKPLPKPLYPCNFITDVIV